MAASDFRAMQAQAHELANRLKDLVDWIYNEDLYWALGQAWELESKLCGAADQAGEPLSHPEWVRDASR